MSRPLAVNEALCLDSKQQNLLFQQADVLTKCPFEVWVYVKLGFWTDQRPHLFGSTASVQECLKWHLCNHRLKRKMLNGLRKLLEPEAWLGWMALRPTLDLALLRPGLHGSVLEMDD